MKLKEMLTELHNITKRNRYEAETLAKQLFCKYQALPVEDLPIELQNRGMIELEEWLIVMLYHLTNNRLAASEAAREVKKAYVMIEDIYDDDINR